MQILPATPNMSSQLVSLCQTLGYEATEKELKQRLQEIAHRPDHILFVAKDNQKIVSFCHGYIRTLVEVPKAVEIGGLVVDSKYQGQGIGKKLLHSLEDWALSQKITVISLRSNITRTKTHQFYEHLGYIKTKQQFRFKKYLKAPKQPSTKPQL